MWSPDIVLSATHGGKAGCKGMVDILVLDEEEHCRQHKLRIEGAIKEPEA